MKSKNKRQLSRRQFLGATAGVAVAASGIGPTATAALGQATKRGAAAKQGAAANQDLILINGRIHTMDARNTIVRSVTIRNGRLVTVSDAAPASRASARVIDLKGRTAVPG